MLGYMTLFNEIFNNNIDYHISDFKPKLRDNANIAWKYQHVVEQITSTDKGVSLVIEVPGLDKNDIEIKIEEQLIVSSTHKTRGFKKRYDLSEKLDVSAIDATCSNGLLTIFIPYKKVNKEAISVTIK